MSSETMQAGRELDALVAEHVMGWRVERVQPDWYPVEVLLFFEPGHTLVSYSWDARSCNAVMYRNGVDASDGTAPVLPSFSDDITAAWLVVERLRAEGWRVEVMASEANAGSPTGFAFGESCCRVSVTKNALRGFNIVCVAEHSANGETPALAICRAALAALTPPEGAPHE